MNECRTVHNVILRSCSEMCFKGEVHGGLSCLIVVSGRAC